MLFLLDTIEQLVLMYNLMYYSSNVDCSNILEHGERSFSIGWIHLSLILKFWSRKILRKKNLPNLSRI